MPDMIPFIDLQAQRRRIGEGIEKAIHKVLDHGRFIGGPEIDDLEAQLAAFCGARHAVACASGTAALALAMMAKRIKPGDAVLLPTFTFAATAEMVALFGATPILCDVREDTFNISAESIESGIEAAHEAGLAPRGIITVDLFGLPADYDAIEALGRQYGLWVIDDAAQSYGCRYKGRGVGELGDMAVTSFYPAKPLGAYGEGGAVFTDDDDTADLLRSLRSHGQGDHQYNLIRIGLNARLDSIQAAVLLEKLAVFPEELEIRQRVADRYGAGLGNQVATPRVPEGLMSSWAQYTLRLDGIDRAAVMASLKEEGVPSVVYYPRTLNNQEAYARYPIARGGVAVAERLTRSVLSLPMHAYLDEATQDRIIDATIRALEKGRGRGGVSPSPSFA